MANETPGGQDPKFERRVVRWLLDSDPSIRWQVMRDLASAPKWESTLYALLLLRDMGLDPSSEQAQRAVARSASVRGGF